MRKRNRPPNKEPTALGRLLEGALGDLDVGSRLREHLAVAAWPQVVGRLVGAHTWPERVRDGVLTVGTDSPAWAQELHMRKAELLAGLAAQVGQGVVKDIRFRSGRRRPPHPARGQRRREIPPPASRIRLSEEEIAEAREAAGKIEDPELRAKAERAFLALARMSRWQEQAGWRRCERCGQWQRTGRRWCSSCLYRGRRKDAK